MNPNSKKKSISIIFILIIYVVITGLSIGWCFYRGRPDVLYYYKSSDVEPLLGTFIGALSGIIIVGITYYLEKFTNWAKDLSKMLSNILGPISGSDILVLSLASSIGEEFLFRAALFPDMGIFVSSLIFAVLHTGPERALIIWGILAFFISILFCLLFQYTGVLAAPIAAHFTINFFNLNRIKKMQKSDMEF